MTEASTIVETRSGDLAPADEPEARDLLRVGFHALVADEPVARLHAWEELVARFSEGHVAYPVAVPFLVDLAESVGEPARCAVLALLVQLGHDSVEGETSVRELDAAFASVASRLDRISGSLRLSPRLAKRAARRARGDRYGLHEVASDTEKVEALLTSAARDHALRADEDERTPEKLTAAARALVTVDDGMAAQAITLAHRCLNAGLPNETLLVCSKLGRHGTRAETARIRALVLLGRTPEAREATIELARAWLLPATSNRSVNQVLMKTDVQELVRDVRVTLRDQQIDDLARAIDASDIDVFIEPGDAPF